MSIKNFIDSKDDLTRLAAENFCNKHLKINLKNVLIDEKLRDRILAVENKVDVYDDKTLVAKTKKITRTNNIFNFKESDARFGNLNIDTLLKKEYLRAKVLLNGMQQPCLF
ncbi:hypothetical protein CDIK_1446 [Cucumispora dikerogammari]|nr:hypothetical protein CDIK_1446 [Cucumispora dikerogammari]